MNYSIELLSKAYLASKARMKKYKDIGDRTNFRAERERMCDYREILHILREINRWAQLTSTESMLKK
jgi:hypothetical protein